METERSFTSFFRISHTLHVRFIFWFDNHGKRRCIFADDFQTFHHIVEFESVQNECLSREAIKELSKVAILIDVRNPYFTRKIKKLNKKLLELKTRLLVPTCVFYVRRLFLEHILISGNEINLSLTVLSRIIKSDKRIVRIKKF